MALFLSFLPMLLTIGVLTLLERLDPIHETAADWRVNLKAWAVQYGVALVLLPLVPLWRGHGLVDARTLPFWAGFALFAVVRDLGEYLYHRAQHRVPFLWAMHALHHSDPAMSALTTMRHHWGDQLIKQVTIWSVAGMIVTPTPAIVGAFSILSLWNFYAHSALPGDWGRWSWLINSPGYHRRHHSSRPEHFDSNFAALFPIFDVIAGTYHRPAGMPPTGLDIRPESFADVALWPRRARADRAPDNQTPDHRTPDNQAPDNQTIFTTTLPTA